LNSFFDSLTLPELNQEQRIASVSLLEDKFNFVDRHHLDADPDADPDPTFHPDADPASDFLFRSDFSP
jgi:hypothetical protein